MKIFLLRRFLAVIPLLLAITFITFLFLDLAPGDYFSKLEEDPTITTQQLAQLREEFGLDGGFFERYGKWLWNASRGNFGYSFENRVPVFDLVMERLGNTLLLALSSLLFSWVLGIGLGIFAAVRRNQLADKISSVISFLGL